MLRVLMILALALATPALASDGVLEMNQTCAVETGCFAGDTPGFPITISQTGSYRATGNLQTATEIGVEIEAPYVTVDLNGFTITGGGAGSPLRDGIVVRSDAVAAEIRNGTIHGFPRHGIFSFATNQTYTGTRGVRVIDLRVVENLFSGLNLESDGNLVRGCTARANGYKGIRVGGDSLVIGNTMRSNGSHGLWVTLGDGYGSNVIADNNGGNANPQVLGIGIEIAPNVCGVDATCP